jgi:hypothetical protein
MSSQVIGQRFRVSRGGCWQCLPDCRSRLSRGAEVSQVAYNIPITVSKEYLLQIFHDQGGRCALSGIPIKLSYEKRRSLKYSNTASLDRKNSDLPYQDGNVQWLHKDVNIMKNHYAQDYFISMCASISKLASLP